jgi:hypothetical protein
MKRKQTKYNCRQIELYTVSTMAWKSCLNNLSRFAEWSTLYTSEYIEAQLKAVEAAATLPGALVRNSQQVSLRIELMECGEQNLYNWQSLKLYIMKAMPEALAIIAVKAAGSSYYEKAANNSWSNMQSLLNTGVNFIRLNAERLLVNNTTPSTFLTAFASDAKRFITLMDQYYLIESDNCLAARTKVDANNAIYTELIRMLNDAKLIFKKDAALKRQFVFSALVQKVSRPHPAQMPQVLSNDTTTLFIDDASVNPFVNTKKDAGEMFIMPLYEAIPAQQKVA